MGKSTLQRKGAGRRHAYERLRENILGLTLSPGSRIDEGALVRDLRMSRTPVREALIRLAGEGLVELLPNRGARVTEMPLSSLPEFFETFSLLQRATHRWAALRRSPNELLGIEAARQAFSRVARNDPAGIPDANRDFHAVIAQAGHNAFMLQTYCELLDQGLRLSRFTVIYDPPDGTTRKRHFDAVIAEHTALVEAIRKGDPDATERLAAAHVNLFRKRVVDYLAAGDDESSKLALTDR